MRRRHFFAMIAGAILAPLGIKLKPEPIWGPSPLRDFYLVYARYEGPDVLSYEEWLRR